MNQVCTVAPTVHSSPLYGFLHLGRRHLLACCRVAARVETQIKMMRSIWSLILVSLGIWSCISPILAFDHALFEVRPVSESEVAGSLEYDYQSRKVRVENRVILSLEHLQTAFLQQELDAAKSTLWVELTPDGRQRFAQFTETLNGRSVAFVVQGKVLAAPALYARVEASQIQISSFLEPNVANEILADLKHAIRHRR